MFPLVYIYIYRSIQPKQPECFSICHATLIRWNSCNSVWTVGPSYTNPSKWGSPTFTFSHNSVQNLLNPRVNVEIKLFGGPNYAKLYIPNFLIGDNFHRFGAPMPLEVTSPSHLDSLRLTIIVTALKGLGPIGSMDLTSGFSYKEPLPIISLHKWPYK